MFVLLKATVSVTVTGPVSVSVAAILCTVVINAFRVFGPFFFFLRAVYYFCRVERVVCCCFGSFSIS